MKDKKNIIIIVLSLLFVILCILVKLDLLSNIDESVYKFITSNMNDTTTNIYKVITFFGSTIFMVGLCVLLLVLFIIIKKNIYGYIISGTLIFSTIMNNVIKVIIRRERPIYMIVRETTFSFPSGHTMASVSMYGILIYLINKSNMNKKLKIILSIILGMIPLMVATSRIYLGAHYFSDILGAIMLATIVLLISTKYIKDKKII
ncbi:pAP2 family protein [Clostridium sp. CAG:762]|nr:pAP2 family protein [Clostridium sp. CAG:762]